MLSIGFDATSLHRSGASVVGLVYWDFGDEAFPDRGWTDFVVVVAHWWLRSLGELEFSESAKFRFMEGRVQLEAKRTDSDVEMLARSGNRIVFEKQVSLSDLRYALSKFARRVRYECQQHGWQSRDLEALLAIL